MSRIVTFGELMMRLNPPGYQRILQADSFEISYAGGEANVAVSLSLLGEDAAFVTKLPDNELGQAALNSIRHFGTDVSGICRGGSRLGVYYVEKGASQRASKVIYDRAGSSIAEASPSDFDWDRIFMNAEWFHFTGITPALGGNLPIIIEEACRKAKGKGLTVSCDLNYRSKLWSREEARSVMSRLMEYVDVCIANEEDAYDVFGIAASGSDIEKGQLSKDGYISVAEKIRDMFGCRYVAITFSSSISASLNNWSGMLYDGNAYFAKEYQIQLVDRVGGGDSFGAGLIYSLINGSSSKDAIEFAVAASCLKQTIEHDFNIVTADEVRRLAAGNSSGRVQR